MEAIRSDAAGSPDPATANDSTASRRARRRRSSRDSQRRTAAWRSTVRASRRARTRDVAATEEVVDDQKRNGKRREFNEGLAVLTYGI